MLSLRVHGFAPVMQSKSLQEPSRPLSGSDGVDLGVHGRTDGQDTAFRYNTYVLFYMLHDAIGKTALYELETSRNKLERFQLPVNNVTLPIVFATWPITTVSDLGVKGRQAVGTLVIDFDNEKRSLSNKIVIYNKPGEAA